MRRARRNELMIAILIVIAILIAMGLVLYGRNTSEQAKALYSIGEALKKQEKIDEIPAEKEGHHIAAEPKEEATELVLEKPIAPPKTAHNVGRSGKAYTKEELELQIRD